MSINTCCLFFIKNFILLLTFWYLLSVILILVVTAFYTLGERKIMASIQRRKGPNAVGLFGLLQPVADGLKLVIKTKITPLSSNPSIFTLAPLPILCFSIIVWFLVFFNKYLLDAFYSPKSTIFSLIIKKSSFFKYVYDYGFFLQNINFNYSLVSSSLLIILVASSLSVYSIILSGWSSSSKYAFLGSLRSGAQMISYEVSMGLTVLPVVLLTGYSFDVNTITTTFYTLNFEWNFFFLMPAAVIFFVSILAEMNRTPFDLTEAEAELVAGYNVEYSSFPFAMFFLAEYTNMVFSSLLISFFFFGSTNLFGWLVQILFFSYLIVLIRATFPRYKYNDLMNLGWKVFLPISLSFLLFVVFTVFFYNCQLLS